ncbi:hypothetical protein [Limosilactobacillus reuteri]|uniref:hypothetical protein n=1 Tax=Limosilactobacillus reuteri TaxID=1598 RepID=UPI001E302389|nr:hypothetical protein [Limosilactobacillus reuteri]MCC4486253.1 hypothetical protein [Limosilactobacillus reuteri]
MAKQIVKNGEPKTLQALVKKQQWEAKINRELQKINNEYLPRSKANMSINKKI